jgi:hypothetical protein
MRILLAGKYSPEAILRQTPQGAGLWRDAQFCLSAADEDVDWLVVLDEPVPFLKTRIPKERRILFVTEPDDIRHYPLYYLNHFGTVVSPVDLPRYRGRHVKQQPALPWWLGAGHYFDKKLDDVWSLEQLQGMAVPAKPRMLSVVCSTQNQFPMHKRRLDFVIRAKAYFGDGLHWYGRGIKTVADKGEALLPYRYNIMLENNHIDHFWTEKLADCYLAYTFPIYSGCRNAGDYFPRDAFEPIDIDDFEGTIAKIKRILDQDPWQDRLGAIRQARLKVLNQYNFFNACLDIVSALEPSAKPALLKAPDTIYPLPLPFRERVKIWERRFRRRIRRSLEQRGLIKPRKPKWKDISETAVPKMEAKIDV